MTCVDVPDLGHYVPAKPVLFHHRALADLREMPAEIQRDLGRLLRHLQNGRLLAMPHSRPMPVVALGVEELRVKDASGQYRSFIVRKAPCGILVLHVFAKKSRETPRGEIELARRRLREMKHGTTEMGHSANR
jgi:phage-related protein